ncbi:MAG: hypothetical protein GY906_11590 [bacterium]|nr:hypothetical protein [bacterium]
MNGSKELQVRPALAYASGTADRNGAVIDTQGFVGVMMVMSVAAIAAGAVTSIKAQQGAVANLSDAADLLGTKIDLAADDDDQTFIIDIAYPTERYLRIVVDKDAANAVAESALYILYGAKNKPVVQTLADTVTFECHISPAEGTA